MEKLRKDGELTRLQRRAVGRVGHNKATTALANKLARIAYAVVCQGRDFDSDFLPDGPGGAGSLKAMKL